MRRWLDLTEARRTDARNRALGYVCVVPLAVVLLVVWLPPLWRDVLHWHKRKGHVRPSNSR